MTDLNSVSLIGRIVKTPELITKSDGLQVVNFSIAVNRDRKMKDKDEWTEKVSYFELTLFGERAKNLHKWLEKGKLVSVRGYLEQERWEKDGNKLSKLKIVPVEINPFIERTAKGNDDTAVVNPYDNIGEQLDTRNESEFQQLIY